MARLPSRLPHYAKTEDISNWEETASYVIHKDNSFIIAVDGDTGKEVSKNTNFVTVFDYVKGKLTSGGLIFIKRATYSVASSVILNANHLSAFCEPGTIFQATAADPDPVIQIGDDSALLRYMSVHNPYVDTTNCTGNVTAIQFIGSQHGVLTNPRIYPSEGKADIGIHIYGSASNASYYNMVINPRILLATNGVGIQIDSHASTFSNANTIDSGTISANHSTTTGFSIGESGTGDSNYIRDTDIFVTGYSIICDGSNNYLRPRIEEPSKIKFLSNSTHNFSPISNLWSSRIEDRGDYNLFLSGCSIKLATSLFDMGGCYFYENGMGRVLDKTSKWKEDAAGGSASYSHGKLLLQSGATNTNYCELSTNGQVCIPQRNAAKRNKLKCRFRLQDQTQLNMYFGWQKDATHFLGARVTAGVGAANMFLVHNNGGAETTDDSGISIATLAVHDVVLDVADVDQIYMNIDGVEVASINEALFSGDVEPVIHIATTEDVNKRIQIDHIIWGSRKGVF